MSKGSKKESTNDKEVKESVDEVVEENKSSIEEPTEEDSIKQPEASENTEEFQKEISNLKDQLLRKAAEFENYKRRTENDQLNLMKYAAESFIIKILPIYDDLTRSVNHINESTSVESLKKGLDLVLQKFSSTLEEQGIKRIETTGQPFDFNLHEALMQRPSDEVPPHTILEEVDSGYTYKDKVIKHAKVIVSQEVIEEKEKTDNNSDEQEQSE